MDRSWLGWTEITPKGELVEISDSQRYKMLGNAVTVNVIEFLGKMILTVERKTQTKLFAFGDEEDNSCA